MVLELVTKNPGKTSKELGELGTLDRYQVARRLSDLHNAGLVRKEEVGSNDVTWFVV